MPDRLGPGAPLASCPVAVWRRLSYSTLAGAFRAALADVNDAKVKAFVTDWIETVAQWGADI
ncbi:MAG: hypothetical protein KBI47_12355 [Armatimonadetes bacterium]|nr:hypothetical protein [Armatimonadota bacterium]